MVPQQSQDGNVTFSQSDVAAKDDNCPENSTVFGSQTVNENSNTPYTDATQVSIVFVRFRQSYFGLFFLIFSF